MTEYIKREDALKIADEFYDHPIGKSIAKSIFCLPSADVRPVVYCKECKHRPVEECRRIIAPKYADGYADYECPFVCEDPWYNRMPADDDYCSCGEKREES